MPKKVAGYAILFASTICKNKCPNCQYKHLKPCLASFETMKTLADHMRKKFLWSVIDISGRDITLNNNLVDFLAYCKALGVMTSLTLGTPNIDEHLAKTIFENTYRPRLSLDGNKKFTDSYRGEGNYDNFLKMISIAKDVGASNNLDIIFTAFPKGNGSPGNINKRQLGSVLHTVRKYGSSGTKILVNLMIGAKYSESEWALLKTFGRQAQVVFSLAKQKLYETGGNHQNKPRCKAFITMNPTGQLLGPCVFFPKIQTNIHNSISQTINTKKWKDSTRLCGQMDECEGCLASCYLMPSGIFQPNLSFVLRHLPSTPAIQNIRDRLVRFAGLVRPLKLRYPNSPLFPCLEN